MTGAGESNTDSKSCRISAGALRERLPEDQIVAYLGDAGAVAQLNELQLAFVGTVVNPATHRHHLPDVFGDTGN